MSDKKWVQQPADLVLRIWYKKDTPRHDKEELREMFITLTNYLDNLSMYEITPECFYEKEIDSNRRLMK